MKSLTKEMQKSHQNAKICYISKEKFKGNMLNIKKYSKVRDHCHRTGEYRGVVHSM